MKLKLAVSLLLAAIFVIAAILFPTYLFSPGELHKSHAKIENCATCHQAFAKPKGQTCITEGCHDSAYWDGKKGVVTEHLAKTGCNNCHTEHTGVNGKITVHPVHKNVTADANCLDCHRLTASHATAAKPDCKNCHGLKAWRPARFDHTLMKSGQTCATCHKLPVKHAKSDADCKACHQTKAWKPARFDHALLKSGQTCATCHKLPVKHFKTDQDCAKCHGAAKWKPADFAHRFPMTHENRGMKIDCAVCHPRSLDLYSCFGCHEHTARNVRNEHLEEGIRNYDDCMKCHPTGREHEGEGGKYERDSDNEREGGFFDWLFKKRRDDDD